MNTTSFEKLLTTTRHWLKGLAAYDNRFYDVLHALDFFAHIHKDEVRKDGKTLGFYHQLNMLAFARTQHRNITDPASVYIAILGHDAVEDYPERFEEIANNIGQSDLRNICLLDKNRSASFDSYMEAVAQSEVCSVVKGIDRIHNYSTMAGVFSRLKQESYAEVGRMYFLPMLKTARRRFPRQEPLYELLKSVMMMQIHATDHLVEALRGSQSSQELPTTHPMLG